MSSAHIRAALEGREYEGARVLPRGPGPTAGSSGEASAAIPVAGAARGGSPLRHASPLKTGGSVTVQAASPLKTVPATSAPPVPPLPSSGPPLPAGSLSPPPVWRPVVPGAESTGGRLLSPRERGPQSPQRGTLGGGARQSSAEQLQRNLRVTTTERLLSSQAMAATLRRMHPPSGVATAEIRPAAAAPRPAAAAPRPLQCRTWAAEGRLSPSKRVQEPHRVVLAPAVHVQVAGQNTPEVVAAKAKSWSASSRAGIWETLQRVEPLRETLQAALSSQPEASKVRRMRSVISTMSDALARLDDRLKALEPDPLPAAIDGKAAAVSPASRPHAVTPLASSFATPASPVTAASFIAVGQLSNGSATMAPEAAFIDAEAATPDGLFSRLWGRSAAKEDMHAI